MVEWHFLRFDPHYRALDWDCKVAYLHLWATCVHVRVSKYTKREIVSDYLSELCGVPSELLVRMIAVAGSNLISRGPGGSITVVGVAAKHAKLRGWDEKRLSGDCGPDRDRTGPDQTETITRTGSDPRASQSLADQVAELRARDNAKAARD